MRKARDRAILIDVEEEEDVQQIESIDFNKIRLKIEQPRKIDPCIIIFDIDKKMTKDEIMENLWNKNLSRAGLKRKDYENDLMFRFSTKNKDANLIN